MSGTSWSTLRLSLKSTLFRIQLVLALLVIGLGADALLTPGHVSAAFGSVLRTLTPSPSGNGRAITVDPQTGRIFYTNSGDPHIYITDALGTPLMTITPHTLFGPPINYASLSWQATSTGGVLWGGRYDGSGAVDRIDPNTGFALNAFTFQFPSGDSCYGSLTGYIDGLAYDTSDNTLWIGDDAARHLFHVTVNGTQIGTALAVPGGYCRTGIAVASGSLWFGLQSGPDQSPYLVARVAKADTTTIVQSIAIPSSDTVGGPEGVAVDHSNFTGRCALWTSQFGSATTLKAWQLPVGLCQGVPSYAVPPAPSLKSVGLLTFHDPDLFACVATVVNSANESVIVTARHCFGSGDYAKRVSNIEFAPAHTGACFADVATCSGNPYGVWYATGRDIYVSFAGSPNQSDDFAFVVVKPAANGPRVQQVVGGYPITWDNASNPATDPLQNQIWSVTSYASDDPTFVNEAGGFGPYVCDWIGSTNDPAEPQGTQASQQVIGAYLVQGCGFVDPISLQVNLFDYPNPIQACQPGAPSNDHCRRAEPFGSSGSPWINNLNTGNGAYSIGAIEGTSYRVQAYEGCVGGALACNTAQGNKLGTDAQFELGLAESAHVP